MSGEVKITGLATGIDFDEITSKLVEAEKYQAKKLESWKTTWQTKIDTLTELNNKVAAIRTANNSLRIRNSFVNRIASNSNNTVANIAVDSTAPLGSYKLDVASEVKHKTASRGVADSTTVIADTDGTLNFNDGQGNNIEVDVSSGMTLDQLRLAIQSELNSAGSNATVSYINDNTSVNPLRLQITSANAGTDGKIIFTNDDTNLNFMSTSYDSDFETIKGSSFSIIDPSGTYNGNVNKRLQFKILDSGTVGSGNIRIQWTDLSTNKSSTVTVTGTGEIDITQGFKINIGAGSLTKNDEFAIDLSHPDIQKAQDTGLAQTSRVTHQGLSSAKAAVNSTDGVFSYSYAGNSVQPLQIPANTTLEGLVKMINEDSNNSGVIASIVNDGLGTAQSFHLVLTGKNSGADNQIIINNSTNLTYMTASQFETTRDATNAMIKIDDYPSDSDSWIQKSSNLISDLIPNSSITLKTSGTTLFTVNNDSEAMADKVQAFVDAYNEAISYIDDITKVVLNENSEAVIDEAGVLVGNYAVNIVKSKLKTYVGQRANGFDAVNDDFSLLTQVGLSTASDNTMEFDRELFIQKLNESPDDIINLFSADSVGSVDNATFIYNSGLSTTKAGNYEISADFNNDELTYVKYRKVGSDTWFTSDGNNDIKISADKSYFTIFGGDARGVMISVANGGTSTQTTTLNIKEGKARTFENEMDILFDENEGTTKVLINNYESIIKNIDKRIDRENMRLAQVKSRLEERFARLETNMQTLNSQMSRLQSQIASLPSNNN